MPSQRPSDDCHIISATGLEHFRQLAADTRQRRHFHCAHLRFRLPAAIIHERVYSRHYSISSMINQTYCDNQRQISYLARCSAEMARKYRIIASRLGRAITSTLAYFMPLLPNTGRDTHICCWRLYDVRPQRTAQ